MTSQITDSDAQKIIDILAQFSINDQLSCLTTLIFSHILAACGNDVHRAEPVVHALISHLPQQWQLTRGLYQLEHMEQPALPN